MLACTREVPLEFRVGSLLGFKHALNRELQHAANQRVTKMIEEPYDSPPSKGEDYMATLRRCTPDQCREVFLAVYAEVCA
jgi:hypothetical protein